MGYSLVQPVLELFFLLLHFLVLFLVIRGMGGKKAAFDGSFYRLYTVQSLSDCVNYVFVSFFRIDAPDICKGLLFEARARAAGFNLRLFYRIWFFLFSVVLV